MEADRERRARGNPGDVTRQIAELGGMTTQELRDKFLEMYGYESTSRNRVYMQKKIAWQTENQETVSLLLFLARAGPLA